MFEDLYPDEVDEEEDEDDVLEHVEDGIEQADEDSHFVRK